MILNIQAFLCISCPADFLLRVSGAAVFIIPNPGRASEQCGIDFPGTLSFAHW
jgi:hypothetical protein